MSIKTQKMTSEQQVKSFSDTLFVLYQWYMNEKSGNTILFITGIKFCIQLAKKYKAAMIETHEILALLSNK